MIRLSTILGLARSEARLARRLVRYWIFQSLAALAGIAVFLYYGLLHRFFSSWSGTADSQILVQMISPSLRT